MKERKRKITVITVIGVMLFSCVATLSYALWERLFTQSDENKISTNCFDITYENESAATTLNKAVPIKEEEGITLTPYKVTIKNTCDTMAKYNVILNKKEGSNLADKNVRIEVDNKTMLLSDAAQIEKKTISNYQVNSSYIIGTGYSLPKSERTINIRSWLDYETTEDEGQNKSFLYKITIETGATKEEGKLEDYILTNSKVREEEPDFTKGFPNSSTTSEDITNKSGIYAAMDDDGISYYFRGKVDNNYVKLSQNSDLIWRIVRINGDGSIRLILNEEDDNLPPTQFASFGSDNKNAGYTYDNSTPCTIDKPCTKDSGTSSLIKTKIEAWYDNYLSSYDNKIALTKYCNDTNLYVCTKENAHCDNLDVEHKYNYYGAVMRYGDNSPSLECSNPTENYGGIYQLKIGLLNGDELMLAGAYPEGIGNEVPTKENYLYHDKDFWWTMSPYDPGDAVLGGVHNTYSVYYGFIDYEHPVFPVINLKSDVTVTGSGTAEDPYVVE